MATVLPRQSAAEASSTQIPAYHGGRLRYASPEELPSYPSAGLKSNGAAASAAASLGWTSHKSPDIWTPDQSASAASAAVLAKDYRMAPTWQPDANASGPRTAALLAVGSAAKAQQQQALQQQQHQDAVNLAARRLNQSQNQPAAPSAWGSSAATHAFKAGSATGVPSSAQLTPPEPVEVLPSMERQKSLRAARGAMAGAGGSPSQRPRAKSTPQPTSQPKESYPDEANAAANALSAATIAHRPSVSSRFAVADIPIEEGGAVPFTTMDRQMYTSHPPVQPEVEDKNRADVLHASAVAMAKRMFTQQQKVIDATKQAHADDIEEADDHPMPLNTLQEAAYRLAQERLAKLHQEHQRNREFVEYYGGSSSPGGTSSSGRRFSMRGRLRRRSSSDGDVGTTMMTSHSSKDKDEDRARSQHIRNQMSLFSSRLSEVDEQKRRRDREALLAAAQRNVKAQLQGMDEKMYAETGRATPAMLTEWELKAHAAAQARVASESKAAGNADKVDIGGGKFMDRKEIDEIAAKRVQPVLDEINEKAEVERERQITARLDAEAKQRELERKRVHDREEKEIHRKLREHERDEERARKQQAKQEEKARKDEEKSKRNEGKAAVKAAEGEKRRAAKDNEKRKSKDAAAAGAVGAAAVAEHEEKQKSSTAKSAEQPSTAESAKVASKPEAIVVTPPPTETQQKLEMQTQQQRPVTSSGAESKSGKQTSPSSGPSSAEQSSPQSPSKVRSWLKSRFLSTRRRANSSPAETDVKDKDDRAAAAEDHDGTGKKSIKDKGSSFIGGAALAASVVGGAALSVAMRMKEKHDDDDKDDRKSPAHADDAGTTAGPSTTDENKDRENPDDGLESWPPKSKSTSADNDASLTHNEDDPVSPEIERPGEEREFGVAKGRASLVSSLETEDKFEEAHDGLTPPPQLRLEEPELQKEGASKVARRDSDGSSPLPGEDDDDDEEDTILQPPAPIRDPAAPEGLTVGKAAGGKAGGVRVGSRSPARETRFVEMME